MYDAAALIDAESGVVAAIGTNTLAAQYWISPVAWVKGGIGLSTLAASGDGDSFSRRGLGLTGGAGYEVVHRGNFAIDISGRLSIADFSDSPAVTILSAVVGVRWK